MDLRLANFVDCTGNWLHTSSHYYAPSTGVRLQPRHDPVPDLHRAQSVSLLVFAADMFATCSVNWIRNA